MKLKASFIILFLVACAPASNPNTSLGSSKPEFYPLDPGLEWVYAPLVGRINDPDAKRTTLTPSSFLGRDVQPVRSVAGLGIVQIFYRQVTPNGVSLLGYDQLSSNIRAEFNPPVLEYPTQSQLFVGSQWGGQSRFDSYFYVDGKRLRDHVSYVLSYSFSVISQEELRVPAGTFQGYKIRKRIRLDAPNSEVIEREIWFVPYIGEIRTEEGLVLTNRNFK